METFFIPVKFKGKLEKSFLQKIAEKLSSFNRICLFTTIQFSKNLQELKSFLEGLGKEVLTIESELGEGVMLGCTFHLLKKVADKCDVFLYLGSGEFHALPVKLFFDKPIVIANPLSNEVAFLDEEKVRKIRRKITAFKSAFFSAKKIGIIVSKKVGQRNLELALKVKEKLEKIGKEAYIFIFDNVIPEDLINFDIDFWINTACPRIAIDDLERFEKPILNYDEIGELIDEER